MRRPPLFRKTPPKPPTGQPIPCGFCDFAAIKGLDTAMSKVGTGYVHKNRAVCLALKDEKLIAKVRKLYEPAEPPPQSGASAAPLPEVA